MPSDLRHHWRVCGGMSFGLHLIPFYLLFRKQSLEDPQIRDDNLTAYKTIKIIEKQRSKTRNKFSHSEAKKLEIFSTWSRSTLMTRVTCSHHLSCSLCQHLHRDLEKNFAPEKHTVRNSTRCVQVMTSRGMHLSWRPSKSLCLRNSRGLVTEKPWSSYWKVGSS